MRIHQWRVKVIILGRSSLVKIRMDEYQMSIFMYKIKYIIYIIDSYE